MAPHSLDPLGPDVHAAPQSRIQDVSSFRFARAPGLPPDWNSSHTTHVAFRGAQEPFAGYAPGTSSPCSLGSPRRRPRSGPSTRTPRALDPARADLNSRPRPFSAIGPPLGSGVCGSSLPAATRGTCGPSSLSLPVVEPITTGATGAGPPEGPPPEAPPMAGPVGTTLPPLSAMRPGSSAASSATAAAETP